MGPASPFPALSSCELTERGRGTTALFVHGRPDGRGSSGNRRAEESPDSTRQRCRVTPGGGNPRDSATENRPPWSNRRFTFARMARVRVKRCGKSAPGDWQPDPHGKPHREQCRIGISRGAGRVSDTAAGPPWPGGPGWQLEAPGQPGVQRNGHRTGSRRRAGEQNPAYRPSVHLLCPPHSAKFRTVTPPSGRDEREPARFLHCGRREGAGRDSCAGNGRGAGRFSSHNPDTGPAPAPIPPPQGLPIT